MEGKIDIKSLFLKLASRWHYFVITLMIVLPLAYAYTEFAKRVYQVQASILVNGEVKNGMNGEKFMKGMELMTSTTLIEDEVGILSSYNLCESTVRKLDFGVSYFEKHNLTTTELYDNDRAFKIELDSSVNQIIGVPIYIERTTDSTYSVTATGKKVNTYSFYTNRVEGHVDRVDINVELPNSRPYLGENLSFKIKFLNSNGIGSENKFFFIINDLSDVAESYKAALDIKPISRESNIVEINLKGNAPKKEIRFVNRLMEVYLANELQKKNLLGFKTIKFIDDQLSGVSDELRQVEGSLESFRSRNNILNINTAAENLTRNLEKLENDKSVLELKLKYYKYIATNLDDPNSKDIGAPSTFGLEDPLLNNLLMDLTRLNQERIGLNYGTKEGNPVAEVIDLKIASAKKALKENVNNFIKATTLALTDLNTKIAEINRNVQGLPKSERELVSIQRRFDFNDNVYNYLLEKRAEAGIAIASNTVEKLIVDRAKQVGDGPVSPNKKVIMLLAFLFGIGFSVVLVIVKDLVNDSIITTQDVESSTPIPFIGSITHGSKSDRQAVIVANAKTALGESFRSLRVNLQYLTLGNETNVIGVTSSVESEGKTFCSINLAAAMAQAGRKTVIIDADLRRPKVAASFRMKNEKGLSSYLIGTHTLKDIISPTTIKGLDVITSGPIPPNPIDLIALPKMEELINTLKQHYNTIIIDSSPIGYVSEYIILMKYTNANIYIVRSNYTNKLHLEKINKLYEEKKIKNLSILLNDTKVSLNGYNYVYG
jgi:capsular exopolysaccharide synthesis family protein